MDLRYQNFKDQFPGLQEEKIIIHEQNFEPIELIRYTTKLKMEGKQVIIQSLNGKQYAV